VPGNRERRMRVVGSIWRLVLSATTLLAATGILSSPRAFSLTPQMSSGPLATSDAELLICSSSGCRALTGAEQALLLEKETDEGADRSPTPAPPPILAGAHRRTFRDTAQISALFTRSFLTGDQPLTLPGTTDEGAHRLASLETTRGSGQTGFQSLRSPTLAWPTWLRRDLLTDYQAILLAVIGLLLAALFWIGSKLTELSRTSDFFQDQLRNLASHTENLIRYSEGYRQPKLVVESVVLKPAEHAAGERARILPFDLIITLRNYGGSPALKGILIYFQASRKAERARQIPDLPGIRRDFSLPPNEKIEFVNRIKLSEYGLKKLLAHDNGDILELVEGSFRYEDLSTEKRYAQFSFEMERAFLRSLLAPRRGLITPSTVYYLKLNHATGEHRYRPKPAQLVHRNHSTEPQPA